MKREYTEEEKTTILQELGIVLLNGRLSGGQAAQVLSRRAEIEADKIHKYKEDTIRRHVKDGKLAIDQRIHGRLNLFNVDDIFNLPIDPSKWRSGQPKKGRGRKYTKARPKSS